MQESSNGAKDAEGECKGVAIVHPILVAPRLGDVYIGAPVKTTKSAGNYRGSVMGLISSGLR